MIHPVAEGKSQQCCVFEVTKIIRYLDIKSFYLQGVQEIFQIFSKFCNLFLSCYWLFRKWSANGSDWDLLRGWVSWTRAGDAGLQWIGKNTIFLEHPVFYLYWNIKCIINVLYMKCIYYAYDILYIIKQACIPLWIDQ